MNRKSAALSLLLLAGLAGIAEAGRYLNGRYLNGRYLNGRYLNGRYLNSADLSGATGGSTFYNPWNGASIDYVSLDRTTFSGWRWTCSVTGVCFWQQVVGDGFVGTWTTGTLDDNDPSTTGKVPTYTYIAGRANPSGDGVTFVYDVQAWAQDASGTWNWLPACTDQWGNPEGAVPLMGEWDYTSGARVSYGGTKFTWACVGTALGKCANNGPAGSNAMGYSPWKAQWSVERDAAGYWIAVDGQSSHQSCTRMVRADYCGDGRSWTADGTAIDLRDNFEWGQRDVMDGTSPTYGFGRWGAEAVWGESGAIWMSCTRMGQIGVSLNCTNNRYVINNYGTVGTCFTRYELPTPNQVHSAASAIPWQLRPRAGQQHFATRTSLVP
jgi:hypothetical protein